MIEVKIPGGGYILPSGMDPKLVRKFVKMVREDLKKKKAARCHSRRKTAVIPKMKNAPS